MKNPKGKIMEEQFYNNAYNVENGSTYDYNKHYSKMTVYHDLWLKVLEYLKLIKDPNILEIGCGTGQFAQMLYDRGYKNYSGIDFSDIGIKKSKERCPNYTFYRHDLRIPFDLEYDTILALEVFEHLDDMKVISNLKSGSNIIFTLSMSDYCAHIRYFISTDEVWERYSMKIELERVEHFHLYFIGKGIIK